MISLQKYVPQKQLEILHFSLGELGKIFPSQGMLGDHLSSRTIKNMKSNIEFI